MCEIVQDIERNRRNTEEREKELTKHLEEAAKSASAEFIVPVSDAMAKAIDAHVRHANERVAEAKNAVERQGQDFARLLQESKRAARLKYWITVGAFSATLIGFVFFFYMRTEPARLFDAVMQEQAAREQQPNH